MIGLVPPIENFEFKFNWTFLGSVGSSNGDCQ